MEYIRKITKPSELRSNQMSSQQMNVMGNDDGGSSGDEAHFAAMSTSTVRTSVQRKRQRTSKAWETFTFIPGNQFADNISRAQCKNCPKLYVVGKGDDRDNGLEVKISKAIGTSSMAANYTPISDE